jgi:hypothetical protein
VLVSERADDGSSAVVVYTVTEFQRLGKYLAQELPAKEPPHTERESALAVLGSAITLLSSGSVGPKGQFLLLRAAADGLRLLVPESTEQKNTEGDTRQISSWDLGGLLRTCAECDVHRSELSIPGLALHWGDGAFFTSLRAVGDAMDPTAPAGDGSGSGATGRSAEAKHARGAAAAAAHGDGGNICAPILRCAVSATWSVLQLGRPAYLPSLQAAARKHTAVYLSWLALPEFDVRCDLAGIFAVLCASAGLEGERSYVIDLSKQLQQKISAVVESDTTHSPAVRTAVRWAAGALRCTGELVASLTGAGLETEAQQLASAALECCRRGCSQSCVSLEDFMIQVVSLEVLQSLAGRMSDGDLSSFISLLRPLLVHGDARVAVPAIACYSSLCRTPGTCDTYCTNSYLDDTDGAVDVYLRLHVLQHV